jgi:hypothetical protein
MKASEMIRRRRQRRDAAKQAIPLMTKDEGGGYSLTPPVKSAISMVGSERILQMLSEELGFLPDYGQQLAGRREADPRDTCTEAEGDVITAALVMLVKVDHKSVPPNLATRLLTRAMEEMASRMDKVGVDAVTAEIVARSPGMNANAMREALATMKAERAN